MGDWRGTESEIAAMLMSYQDNSFCPIYRRDEGHGDHPRCRYCRFKEIAKC